MSIDPEIIQKAVQLTQVLRFPKQSLATFGTTSITYYMVSEPVYQEIIPDIPETVVRRGKVTSERPRIVTPYYLLSLFEGFEHGTEFSRYLYETYGPDAPGLYYAYRNELEETSVVSDPIQVVAGRLAEQLERDNQSLAAVIRGDDQLWDVSIMKFIYEITSNSLSHNLEDLNSRGLLGTEGRLPRAARLHIEEMFMAVSRGDLDPRKLKDELDRWGVFEEYEDRFLGLFRRKRG